MKTLIRNPYLALFALSLSLTQIQCTDDAPEVTETQMLIRISSIIQVDKINLAVRTLEGEDEAVSAHELDIDISSEPFDLLLKPSDTIKNSFFFHAQGLKNDQVVVAAAKTLTFASNARVEYSIKMLEGFEDEDGDGYEKCDGELGECDCDDNQATINPYTLEVCGDKIDNNCSGFPVDEGCPCEEGDTIYCTNLPGNLLNLAGIGACAMGEQKCIEGEWEQSCNDGIMQGLFNLSGEVANNNIDDDCDGHVDEGSTCALGDTRDCFLGFIGDAARSQILLQGACQLGTQSCQGGKWGECEGQVLPTKVATSDFVGWVELPYIEGEDHECDGKDNDCDGEVDEDPTYDLDGDGYTFCGTNIGDESADGPSLLAGTSNDYVDCDDTDAAINPAATELCGNQIDEDCRCDHGTNLGEASQDGAGEDLCENSEAETNTYLDCTRTPRSGSNALGSCGPENGEDTYYYDGFINNAQDPQCYVCAGNYGNFCDVDAGSCRTREQDCSDCVAYNTSQSESLAGVSLERPVCTDAVSGTCSETIDPAWVAIAKDADTYNDCPEIACDGSDGDDIYYHGFGTDDEAQAGSKPICYIKANVDPGCNGSSSAPACQTDADLCPDADKGEASARPECKKPTSCTDTTVVYTSISAGEDPYNDCETSCDGAGECYQVANGEACTNNYECVSGFCTDGVCCDDECEGQCQSCLGTHAGLSVEDDGTCRDIPDDTDPDGEPDGECAGELECNGQGACQLSNGQSCSSANQCRTNNCVDDVCCDSACDAEFCEACDITGSIGTCTVVPDAQDPDNECTTTCDGNGNCHLAQNTTCTLDSQCDSNFCRDGYCCDKDCTGVCESCKNDDTAGGNGNCLSVSDGDNPNPPDDCGSNTCNGLGACHLDNGETCTAGTDCTSNNCVDGVCCNQDSSTCGPCRSCLATHQEPGGSDGTCDDIADGEDPNLECTDDLTCNGSGACHKDDGVGCIDPTDCESNFCVDGVCCDTACTDTCKSCKGDYTGGSDGTCSSVTDGNQDDQGTETSCTTSGNACYGGSCLLEDGENCTSVGAAGCISGNCVDGRCCDTACIGGCNVCSTSLGADAEGVCKILNDGENNNCSGGYLCDGTANCPGSCIGDVDCDDNLGFTCPAGTCQRDGIACNADGDCESNEICKDSYCCADTCTGVCEVCSAILGATANGTCTDAAEGTDPHDSCGSSGESPACNG
ncbi:MAG: MopE-related protein, partial [Myxococcota bacterium]|nr:MopE-related protein [Myxococcota bacterium]